MNLTAVESSHIAAVGYLEAERVLLVRYKDGTLYAFPGWDNNRYAGLVRAESKGRFLTWCKGSGILITKGVMPTEAGTSAVRGTVAEPGDNAAPSPGSLNMIDEDADKCCRKNAPHSQLWNRVDAPASWECPDCGTRFNIVVLSAGGARYWRIVPAFAVHRRAL